MKALILAAGYATRLYPLTKDRPKALLPIAERPIIYYIMDKIVEIPKIDEIIVVSNHRFIDDFLDWQEEAQALYEPKITVVDDHTVSDEDKLGAIGDINYVINKLDISDDLLVIAGDNLFTYSLLDAYKVFKEANLDMIVAKPLDNIEKLKSFAVVDVDENNIVQFLEEKPQDPQSNLAVYATYFYKAETLKLFPVYLEKGFNPDSPGNFPAELYKHKPVKVYEFAGKCFDIGTPDSYKEVNQLVKRHPEKF